MKGDLLLLPTGAVHWFDGGERPRVVMVRGFDSAQVPDFAALEGDFAMGFAGLSDARRFCSALVAGNADCIPVTTR